MANARNLSDFLATAGVKTAAPVAAPAAAPSTPAPAKTAAPVAKVAEGAGTIPSSQPTTEAAGGHKPRDKKTEENAQDTGKTAAQKALAERGIVVADVKIAEVIYGDLVKKAEDEKRAELEKKAAEVRAQGALIYQGMIQENTAWKLASGDATLEDAKVIANVLGISLDEIAKRAEQIGGAMPSPALVGGNLGSAARVDNSVVMRKGEEAKTEIQTRDVEAISGTRAPVSGADEKLKRFTDVATLPGNPGLNHGQAVDQGKGLSA
jgi:hypothetical protein